MSPAWIACGIALMSASAAMADEPFEPICSACEELVGIVEKELGFELGRRVYPDRSVLDTERVILPSPVAPNWGGVFHERAGAVRFVNSRRTSSIQIWGDVVPVAGEADSDIAFRAAGKDPPAGVLVLGVGVRVAF